MSGNKNKSEGQNKEPFEFLRQRTKEKPMSKRKMLLQLGFTVVLAMVFGLVSCVVFTVLQPRLEELFTSGDATVTIPEDEESTDDSDDSDEVIIETQQLETEDYQSLYKKLYSIGKEANKSIVTVTGVTSETDWADSSYESEGSEAGLIVAKSNGKMLIMAEYKAIEEVKSINVTFIDGKTYDATLKGYDGNTGLAILSISLDAMEDSTLDSIHVASLGNSYEVTQGQVVLALGSPLGSVYSILTGTTTSISNQISAVDHVYTIFTTDMVGSSTGSGVLINLDGEVVGIILQDFSNEEDENTITAISVSELKSIIEQLSNGEEVPYLGIKMTTVTSEIAQEYDIPYGVYVKSVEVDSPALTAGIQTGDVVVEVDGMTVDSVEDIENWLEEASVDEKSTITVKRYGNGTYKSIEISVTIGSMK